MIKGIIFDLDGVLTFTDKYHYMAWKKIADEEDIYFDEEINKRLRGVSRLDSLEIILERANKEYTQEDKVALAEKKNKLYIELLANLSSDDVAINADQVLNDLRGKGLKLAVGSSSKNTNLILKNTNLGSYFDVVVDGNMIEKSKPNPEVFLKAAELLGIKPSEALVVEDAVAGIEAGVNGGFMTVAISTAKESNLPNYKINVLADLLNIIDEEKKNPLFKLEHIKKVYPNGVCAIEDFSLDIYPGEFMVFVGPSGCGKSTVLRMIAGLEEITDGAFYIDGEEMSDSDPKDRDIAMVFQNYALYPHKNVRQNIGFPLYMKSVGFKHFFDIKYRINRRKEIDKKVESVAETIGLSEYLDRKPKNLSGGQRQRVALGRAIIRNPKAFLLDEPLSNLDAKMRAEMRTEISKLHSKLGTLFIYVTHDQIEAMTMASRIVVMKDGYIQQVGTPREIFMHPKNMFVAGFIGTPPMNFIDGVIRKEDKIYFEFTDGNKIDLPDSVIKKLDLSYIDKNVVLGIRPKAINIVEDSNFKGKVTICEQLGDEALVYFKYLTDKEYVASLSTYEKYEEGQEISLSFDLEHCSLFSKETEGSILNEED